VSLPALLLLLCVGETIEYRRVGTTPHAHALAYLPRATRAVARQLAGRDGRETGPESIQDGMEWNGGATTHVNVYVLASHYCSPDLMIPPSINARPGRAYTRWIWWMGLGWKLRTCYCWFGSVQVGACMCAVHARAFLPWMIQPAS
jgi:hypothetical protein